MAYVGHDSYQTMVHPDYFSTTTEAKVGLELDVGRLLPQVSELMQNLSEEAYRDLDVLFAEMIKERCLGGKDLGDNLNQDVDKFIQQICANL